MLTPEQQEMLNQQIFEKRIAEEKKKLRSGSIEFEAQARGMRPFEIIKERFAETPQEDKAPAVLSGMFKGTGQGLNTAKEGFLGANKAPQYKEMKGGAGQGQRFGQFVGQSLPVIGAGIGGTAIGGPVGGIGMAALMAAATTPGDTSERVQAGAIEGGLGAATYGVAKAVPIAFRGLKKVWDKWKAPEKIAEKMKTIENKLTKTGEDLTAEEAQLFNEQRKAYLEHKSYDPLTLEGKKVDLETKVPELEQKLPNLADMVRNEEGIVAQTESEIMDRLNKIKDYSKISQAKDSTIKDIRNITKANENADVLFSKELTKDFKTKLEETAANKYNELISDLASSNHKLSIDSWPRISKKVTSALNSGGVFAPNEAQAVLKLVNKLDKAKSHNTSNVLNIYRNLNNVEYEVSQAARGAATHAERAQAWAAKNRITAIKNELKELMEVSGSGKKAMERLAEANAMWTNVAKVKGNSFYKAAANKGKFGNNIIKMLRGTEEGHDIINQLVRENPKLVETAFGHSYGKNPIKALEDLSIGERDIIRHSPALDKKITELGEHQGKLDMFPNKEPFTNYEENLKKVKKEFESFIKDKDGKIPSRAKLAETEKEIAVAKGKIESLDAHIEKLNTRMQNIKEQKSSSKALENEYNALKREKIRAEGDKKSIKYGIGGSLGTAVGIPGLMKIYDWLSKED